MAHVEDGVPNAVSLSATHGDSSPEARLKSWAEPQRTAPLRTVGIGRTTCAIGADRHGGEMHYEKHEKYAVLARPRNLYAALDHDVLHMKIGRDSPFTCGSPSYAAVDIGSPQGFTFDICKTCWKGIFNAS